MNLQGKRAAIVTLGCKVNQYETDAMYGMLKEAGVTMVDPKEAADIYIVNTCSVTNMAERKSRQMLHRAKKKNPDVVVVAVGCYAQVGKEELSKDTNIDLIIGNNKKKDLIHILEEHMGEKESAAESIEVIDIAHDQEYERAAATAVSDWAADKRQYYEDTTTLKEENAALKKEIADLRAQQRQAQADSEENKLLRELLKLQQQRRDFTFVSTAVLAHSESSWTSSLSLNHGTDQDIAVGDCVVSAEGYLVGVISEVGLNWSTVLTVIDTDTELGARIFRTGEVAVAEGDFSLMGQGKLKLSYLTSDDEVLIGDQIVTSGLGGYYPSGLVIGSVESLQTGDDGLARYAVLAPMMDFAALTEVFVITDYDIVD